MKTRNPVMIILEKLFNNKSIEIKFAPNIIHKVKLQNDTLITYDINGLNLVNPLTCDITLNMFIAKCYDESIKIIK